MSVYKPFITSDVIVSPFKVNKSFTFTGNELTGSNVQIDRFLGTNNTSSLWVSGSDNTGYITSQSSQLVYRSIKELYYSNYIGGENGAPAATASFNNDGTITGPAYTPNYYNYLSNTLPPNRYLTTGSDNIVVISIPSNLFGEYIAPNSVQIQVSGSTISVQDDGLGNILFGTKKVGDIIYQHGIIIITQTGYSIINDNYGTGSYGDMIYGGSGVDFINNFYTNNLTCSFKSTVTIYETQYKCTIRENEFNFSNNPSLLSGSTPISVNTSSYSGSLFPQPGSGKLNDNVTGSYFSPYITTVGLYNNNKELLAVAKLAQPLPVSSVTDTSILINFDF
jgi:hypothetical protein